jgi:hypothetical protein
MRKLDYCINRTMLTGLKLIMISTLSFMLTYSVKAQLTGQLPVNLKTFKARVISPDKVEVFWTTEYEKDNLYFDIERSVDGVNFIAVGKINGVNQHGILTNYTFYDNRPLKGISYYRLKQVDINAEYNYSAIERVGNKATANSVDIFPNPSPGNKFKLDVFKTVQGNIDVLVYDLSGRLRLQQQFSNSNTIIINHQLPAGFYNVTIHAKDFTETKKLMIQ